MVNRRPAPPSRAARILAPLIQSLESTGLSGNAALRTLRTTLRRDPFRDAKTGTLITGLRTQEFFRVFTPMRKSSTFAAGVNVLTRRQVPDVLGFALSPFKQKRRFLMRAEVPITIRSTGQQIIRHVTLVFDDMRAIETLAQTAARLAAKNPVDSEVDIDKITFTQAFISA